MTCEAVLGRVTAGATNVDWIEIGWADTVRRALRLQSQGGRRVNLLLPRDHPTLRHGDVIARIDGQTLAVRNRSIAVLHCTADERRTLGLLCAELGNLHVPLEIQEAAVITPDDGPAREIVDRLNVPARRSVDPFHPERFSVLTPLTVTPGVRRHVL